MENKTAREILSSVFPIDILSPDDKKNAIKAMLLYAQQQSIGFAGWVTSRYNGIGKTLPDLYTQFIDEQTKNG